VVWFARVLVPELGQSGSLDQLEGGWTVGANRVATVEDQLTALEASAPDDATRTDTRILRDAVRASRERVEELLQSRDAEAISATLNETAAELEAVLRSFDQAG
jgi:small-conductance mechanosensitive channel